METPEEWAAAVIGGTTLGGLDPTDLKRRIADAIREAVANETLRCIEEVAEAFGDGSRWDSYEVAPFAKNCVIGIMQPGLGPEREAEAEALFVGLADPFEQQRREKGGAVDTLLSYLTPP